VSNYSDRSGSLYKPKIYATIATEAKLATTHTILKLIHLIQMGVLQAIKGLKGNQRI